MSLLRLLSLLVLLILVLLGLDPTQSSAADLAARRAAAQVRLLGLQTGACQATPALPAGGAANGARRPACAGFAVKALPMDSYQGTKARAPKQNTVRGRGLPKMPTTRSTG